MSLGAQQRINSSSGNRWGSGEVEVTSVELLDVSGSSQETFACGLPMTIRVNYEVKQPVNDLVVGIRISHMHGLPMWGSNTKRRSIRIENPVGSGFVDLNIPELPLLEGAFDLTVALSDHAEVNPYDHLENMTRFHVVQNGTFDEGVVWVDGQWSNHQKLQN
jgi:hypothetical protein